jgi:hypothetical protein
LNTALHEPETNFASCVDNKGGWNWHCLAFRYRANFCQIGYWLGEPMG